MSTVDWLTQDHLQEVLNLHHNSLSVRIQKLEIKPVLTKGENYCSQMIKIKVEYTWNGSDEAVVKHLIVKQIIQNDDFAIETLNDYDVFNREMSMYDQVIPKLYRVLKEINDADKIFPTAFYTDYKRQALILNDLTAEGYTMANRLTRLDVDHIHLILRKLAKMHATSAVWNERENGCFETFDRSFFNQYTDSFKTFYSGTFLSAARNLQTKITTQYYAKKMIALEPHYMSIGKRCFTPSPGHVNVLCHGDIWTNNMMFKYDAETGKPIDAKLIDFQYAFWGSPTLDLHYFFNTSIKEPLRRYHQRELFQYYHHYFIESLRKMRYTAKPAPSFEQFISEADEKAFYALHCATVMQPVMLNEDTKDADFSSLMKDDKRGMNFRTRLCNNPVVQENLEFLLPVFDRRGLLEIDQ